MSQVTRWMIIRRSLSLFRQRAILVMRYAFRIPMDEIKEAERKAIDESQTEISRQISDVLQTMGTTLNLLQARLNWYETRVPMLRKERMLFDAKYERLRKLEEARQAKFKELVDSGMPEAQAKAIVWPQAQNQQSPPSEVVRVSG